jgi:site-specific DNA-methyltransferase (adenine-specific)
MGKKWDYDVPGVDVWEKCLRALKPGGHLLSFAGTRTQHRMAVRIEDAGFEIRDMIAWVYGSGFPKSLDVSKAIDKAAGAERVVVGVAGKSGSVRNCMAGDFAGGEYMSTTPATDAARQWQGWGTALKPALEPITVARKPLVGTVVANVLAHGTGAINIDGCRVETDDNLNGGAYSNGIKDLSAATSYATGVHAGSFVQPTGRWPANLIHDGGEFLGEQSRFFYCAKASKADRGDDNNHPTVKPTDLMRYLCRLVTPPGGVIFDPFMGSGSTGKAALLEGFQFIGCELSDEYTAIANARLEAALK